MTCVAVICVGTCGMTPVFSSALSSAQPCQYLNHEPCHPPRSSPATRAGYARKPRRSRVSLIVVTLDQVPRPVRGKPRAGEFVFARLRYDSGDWDYNPKVAANVLNSIVEYTNIAVYPEEVIITADSDELLAFPFLFMTGHKLVRFNERERERLKDFVERGGFLFSDDCNHDVAGPLCDLVRAGNAPRLSRAQARSTSCRARMPIYRSFFQFPDGPPQTAHELNGWGDDLVHDYLRAVELRGRDRRALLEQGLRLRVGLRLAEQALSARRQHAASASTSWSTRSAPEIRRSLTSSLFVSSCYF